MFTTIKASPSTTHWQLLHPASKVRSSSHLLIFATSELSNPDTFPGNPLTFLAGMDTIPTLHVQYSLLSSIHPSLKMTASLDEFLASTDKCYTGSLRHDLATTTTTKEDIKAILPPMEAFYQRSRDERPLPPRRSRSGKMAEARGINSEPALSKTEPPLLAGRHFARLHSDNFLYCSDLAHVRENSKKGLRPVSRQKSIRGLPVDSGTDDDASTELSIDDTVHLEDKDNELSSTTTAPAVRRRVLRNDSFYSHKVVPPRPSYQDRWHAAFGSSAGSGSEDTRGRSRRRASQQGPPRSAKRHESMSRGGHELSVTMHSATTTTSSITTASTISGKSCLIEKFGDAFSIEEVGSPPSVETKEEDEEEKEGSPQDSSPERSIEDIVVAPREAQDVMVVPEIKSLRDSFVVRREPKPAEDTLSISHSSLHTRTIQMTRHSSKDRLLAGARGRRASDPTFVKTASIAEIESDKEEEISISFMGDDEQPITLARCGSSKPWKTKKTRAVESQSEADDDDDDVSLDLTRIGSSKQFHPRSKMTKDEGHSSLRFRYDLQPRPGRRSLQRF